jgi:hypothetical protein
MTGSGRYPVRRGFLGSIADASDSRNVFIPASDAHPELMAFVSLGKRGHREGRVPSSHPRPGCVVRKHTVVTTGGTGSSGLPCAMVLTAYFVRDGTGCKFDLGVSRGDLFFAQGLDRNSRQRVICPSGNVARSDRWIGPGRGGQKKLAISTPGHQQTGSRHLVVRVAPKQKSPRCGTRFVG